jgi:hypothetical protein
MPPFRHHPVVDFNECLHKFGLQDLTLKVAETSKAEFEAVRSFF